MSCLNVNEVRLAGRVVNDPELKTTQSGLSVTSFRIAINRPKKQGENEEADFVTVVAWKERAEFVTRYFHKGMAIWVEGAFRTRSWDDNNGNKRSVLEVVASNVKFIDSKNDNANGDVQANQTSVSADFTEIGEDDDLPF